MGISSVSAADDICRTKKLSETRSSVRNIVNEVSLPTVHGVQSFDAFVTSNSGLINAFVEDYQRNYGSVRLHVRVDAIFTRDVEDGQQRIPAYFSTRVHDVDPTQQFDLHSVDTDLSAQADHWNSRGSSFVLDRTTEFIFCISKYRPLHVAEQEKMSVNVKNTDSKCFLWSVLAALYSAEHHP